MSKPAATPVQTCERHNGWRRLALLALTLLASSVAAASIPEATLRRSEELDIRRLGRTSDEERAALRVTWRAAQTGAEEARSVQELLDSLRRMEATVGEIGRMVRDIPAPAPIVTSVAEKPPEPADHRWRWALAAGALFALLALWWFRRRGSVDPVETAPALSPEPNPDLTAQALEPSPALAGPVETTGPSKPPSSLPVGGAPASDAPPFEPYLSTVVITPPPAAAPVTAADLERTVSFAAAEARASAPPAKTATIDFSLEEADPEAVARANARVPVPRTNTPPRVPERRQQLTVEPTLQLAEIMLSMGLREGATKALLEYVEAHPGEAVYHWLRLLGIYRDGGHRKDFEETAAKLRMHFNIQAVDAPSAGDAPTLESFPRVAKQIQQLWARPEQCSAYLRHLLKDNRDGERMGFPQSVAEELLLLIEVLKGTSGAPQTVGL